MKSFMLLQHIAAISLLGFVTPKPANSEAKNSDTQNGNEPSVNKHFDFSDFLGNIFGGQPGSQSFFPNTQTGNGQMNGLQQQYPNQNPNQGQQNNPNQFQNRPPGNNFGYPNQGNNGGAFNNNNNEYPWQNTGMQQYPNNAGSGQNNNQLPNQGQGQNPNSSGNANTLDWKNLYPGLTLNQPPSQNNNNPQFNSQWPNGGQNMGNQFQNPGSSPNLPVQTPYVNPTSPQQWQNEGQGSMNAGQNQNLNGNPPNPQQWQNAGQEPINPGQNQNPNVNENMPEEGTINSLIPGEVNIPANQAPSTSTTTPILCQQNCPNTAEYNPVCGDNNVTYNNPGSLLCARNCGLTVRLNHRGRCSGDPANRFMG